MVKMLLLDWLFIGMLAFYFYHFSNVTWDTGKKNIDVWIPECSRMPECHHLVSPVTDERRKCSSGTRILGPVLDWDARCRTADAGGMFLDAASIEEHMPQYTLSVTCH
jgi:hypothetical protein